MPFCVMEEVQTTSIITDFIKGATANEALNFKIEPNGNDVNKLDESFDSKHMNRAWIICCGTTVIILLFLLFLWHYFEHTDDQQT